MTDQAQPLATNKLRWRLAPETLGFQSTADVDPAEEVVGQPTASEALQFGIECHARGQNVYVRGSRGTGRRSMVTRMLRQAKPTRALLDYGYVHNFSQPDSPRLITLPAGQARELQQELLEFATFVSEELPKALDSDALTNQRSTIQRQLEEKVRTLIEPLESDLKAADMALVRPDGGPSRGAIPPAIFPLINDEPVPPDQFQMLATQGKIEPERVEAFRQNYPEFQKRLHAIGRQVNDIYRAGSRKMLDVNALAAREALAPLSDPIQSRFGLPAVDAFLAEAIDHVVATRLVATQQPLVDPAVLYGINIIREQNPDQCPVVEENAPSLINLLGTVETHWGPQGPLPADYRGLHAGAMLRADGGYLVLDAHDLLLEPGAWQMLTRTLRTGQLEIVPAELGFMRPQILLKPEPIPVQLRVILIGDAGIYYQLDAGDPDFSELFKVLADFDSELPRNATSIKHYARVLAQLVAEEQLLHFAADGVAVLVEHGVRIASRSDKLTARFGRVADIAREASFLADRSSAKTVSSEHVVAAIARTRARASLPATKFLERIKSGLLNIQVSGDVVGQINGLAVIQAGPIAYGFPARITATMGAGRAGLIDIEANASLSGAIHTKGFHILNGLLRHLLRTGHPLAFNASIAFEQSYGGIDGDSASGAEACCLLSALTEFPIRQDLAITGAIDQHGRLQAIGGVNEKIEGFFDVCQNQQAGQSDNRKVSGPGVIIPASNAGDLMLRRDLVDACKRGKFHIYAVTTIQEALHLLTGVDPGVPSPQGIYPPDSLLGSAVSRAEAYWRKTMSGPSEVASRDNSVTRNRADL